MASTAKFVNATRWQEVSGLPNGRPGSGKIVVRERADKRTVRPWTVNKRGVSIMVTPSATISSERYPIQDVPSGAPRWVTPELVADTVETWQPYYDQRLTEDDAMAILLSVGEPVKALE